MEYPDRIQQAWKKTRIHPYNKDLGLSNEAVVDYPSPGPKKQKRGKIWLTGTMISNKEIITLIREQDQKITEKEAAKGIKRRGRPLGSKNKVHKIPNKKEEELNEKKF